MVKKPFRPQRLADEDEDPGLEGGKRSSPNGVNADLEMVSSTAELPVSVVEEGAPSAQCDRRVVLIGAVSVLMLVVFSLGYTTGKGELDHGDSRSAAASPAPWVAPSQPPPLPPLPHPAPSPSPSPPSPSP